MDETLNDTTTDLVQNAKILIGMPNSRGRSCLALSTMM
jgi:hypothetical protein